LFLDHAVDILFGELQAGGYLLALRSSRARYCRTASRKNSLRLRPSFLATRSTWPASSGGREIVKVRRVAI
jgi:hypothetical protein